MEIKIYIWEQTDKETGKIQYGAELTFPGIHTEWYDVFWLYTPLFDTKEEADEIAEKLKDCLQKFIM